MRQTCSAHLQNSISRPCIIKTIIDAMTNSLSSLIFLISLFLCLFTYSLFSLITNSWAPWASALGKLNSKKWSPYEVLCPLRYHASHICIDTINLEEKKYNAQAHRICSIIVYIQLRTMKNWDEKIISGISIIVTYCIST